MPKEDWADVLQAQLAERATHLRRRRVSGEILTGGQSSATISISSHTGLAETETIQLAAVNALTAITDGDDISFGTYGDWIELEQVEIVGGGFPVLITCTDNYTLTTITLDTLVRLDYRIRLLDPSDTEIFNIEQTGYFLINAGGDGITVAAESAFLQIVAELEDGLTYRLFFENNRDRDNGSDVLNGVSGFRTITLHEIKR